MFRKEYNDKKDIGKETLILKYAEDDFLSKGYANQKTTKIAKRAGVRHAMLHYYFRTKLMEALLFSFKQDLPFLEKLKKGNEDHFDFITANPKLPNFIFNEVINNKASFVLIRPNDNNS